MAGGRKNLSALITFGGRISSSFKRSTSRLQSSIDDVGSTIKKVTARQATLRREIRKGTAAGQDVSRLRRRYRQLGQTVERLTHKQEGLRLAQRGLRLAGRGLVGVFGMLRSAALGVGAAVGAATAGFGAMIAHGVEWSRTLDRNALRIGASTRELQELRLAAAQFGIEAEHVDDAVADFSERIGEALREPDGNIAGIFRQIGVDVRSIRGLDAADQIGAVGDALRQVNGDRERFSFARELLGGDEAANAILALTREGSAGLRRMRDEAQRSIVPEEAQARLRRLGNAWTSIRARVGAVGTIVSSSFGPLLESWLIRIGKKLDGIDFDSIGATIKEFADDIGRAGEDLEATWGPVFEDINSSAENLGGWGKLFSTIGGIAKFTFKGVGFELKKVTFWLDMVTGGFGRIGELASGAWKRIKAGASSLRDRMKTVGVAIQEALSLAWDRIKVKALQTFAEITSRAAEVGATIQRIISGGSSPSSETSAAADGVRSRTRAAAEAVGRANARTSTTNLTNAPNVNVQIDASGVRDPEELFRTFQRRIAGAMQIQGAGALTGG